MSKVTIIADPGSCHCGELALAKELIDVAADCGCDAVKFQLFPDTAEFSKSGNVSLPYCWFEEMKDYGKYKKSIEVFASVFDSNAYCTLTNANCRSIKIAYNTNRSNLLWGALNDDRFDEVYVSGDYMSYWYESKKQIRFYCIPLYPVPYDIDFDGVFDKSKRIHFDGFSDHTRGYSQTMSAVYSGAQYIEKHIRLDNHKCDQVPDGNFALYPDELKKMVAAIK